MPLLLVLLEFGCISNKDSIQGDMLIEWDSFPFLRSKFMHFGSEFENKQLLLAEEAKYLVEHYGFTSSVAVRVDEKRYEAFKYFTQNGWIVKCGMKYGVDFILYSDSVSVVHAEYAVWIRRPCEWSHVIAISRSCSSVKKKLLVYENGMYYQICRWIPDTN